MLCGFYKKCGRTEISQTKSRMHHVSNCGSTVMKEHVLSSWQNLYQNTKLSSSAYITSVEFSEFWYVSPPRWVTRALPKDGQTRKESQSSDGNKSFAPGLLAKDLMTNQISKHLQTWTSAECENIVCKPLRRTTNRKNDPASASLNTVDGLGVGQKSSLRASDAITHT